MDAETIAVRDAQQVARHEGLGSFDAAPVVLQVNDLRKVFSHKGTDDVVAVDGISFFLRAGECVGLVGESGSGKSTTSSLIMRMIEPTAGKVMLMGVTPLLADWQAVGFVPPRADGVSRSARLVRPASHLRSRYRRGLA